jgi:hypothetical protein
METLLLRDRCVDLTELDRLWEPDTSEQGQTLLFHSLSEQLERQA